MVDGEKLLIDIVVENLMADNVRGVLGHHPADPPLEIYELFKFYQVVDLVNKKGVERFALRIGRFRDGSIYSKLETLAICIGFIGSLTFPSGFEAWMTCLKVSSWTEMGSKYKSSKFAHLNPKTHL